MQAKAEVQNTSVMAKALNGAQNLISTSVNGVGRLASKVLSITGQGLGQLGGLVERMTKSSSDKPTPLETYAGLVSKQDMNGTTRMP